MKNYLFILLIFSFLLSCSHKKQMVYLNDINKSYINKVEYYVDNKIQIGDVLKIDVSTVIPEASVPYNFLKSENISNSDLLIVEGYLVYKDSLINYPVLGKINAVGYTENELSDYIAKLLVDDGHLKNPHVKVKKVNSKFTVLGEVGQPGTYSNFDNQYNNFKLAKEIKEKNPEINNYYYTCFYKIHYNYYENYKHVTSKILENHNYY